MDSVLTYDSLTALRKRYKLFRILKPVARFKVRNGKVLHTPRIPECTMTGEDETIPRICVGPSIIHCMAALTLGSANDDIQYRAIEEHIGSHVFGLRRYPRSYRKPGIRRVPDSRETKEGWILHSIHMEYLGRLGIKGEGEEGSWVDGEIVIVPPGKRLPRIRWE